MFAHYDHRLICVAWTNNFYNGSECDGTDIRVYTVKLTQQGY